MISLMLAHRRDRVRRYRPRKERAWEVFFYFTSLLTLSSGLNEIGFIKWVAEDYARTLAGLAPTVGMILLVPRSSSGCTTTSSSITRMRRRSLPVVLAVGCSIPGFCRGRRH